MIQVRCPDCGVRLEVEDADRGEEVRCPSCRAVFVAREEGGGGAALPGRDDRDDRYGLREDEPDDRPRRRRPPDDDFEDRPRRRRRGPAEFYDDSPEDIIDDGREAVRIPAILSLVACIVTILYQIFDTVFMLAKPQALQGNPFFPQGPPPAEMVIIIKSLQLFYLFVVLAGSIAMLRLKAYKFALAAMIMQIIPCGAGVCCILGIGPGIWGLVVLNQPHVKEAFSLAEHYDRG